MHSAIYIVMKTEGEIEARPRGWLRNTIIFFVLMYAISSMATLIYIPRMVDPLKANPGFFPSPS